MYILYETSFRRFNTKNVYAQDAINLKFFVCKAFLDLWTFNIHISVFIHF